MQAADTLLDVYGNQSPFEAVFPAREKQRPLVQSLCLLSYPSKHKLVVVQSWNLQQYDKFDSGWENLSTAHKSGKKLDARSIMYAYIIHTGEPN